MMRPWDVTAYTQADREPGIEGGGEIDAAEDMVAGRREVRAPWRPTKAITREHHRLQEGVTIML